MQKLLVKLGPTPGGSGVQAVVLLDTPDGLRRYTKTITTNTLTVLATANNGEIISYSLFHAGVTQTACLIEQETPSGNMILHSSLIDSGETLSWGAKNGFC